MNNERMNKWSNEWISERMKEWIDEEWMRDGINEQEIVVLVSIFMLNSPAKSQTVT